MTFADPKAAGSGFNTFLRAICEQVGAALEIPADLLLKSFNSSYSASRAALMEAWKAFRMRRKWFVDDFCTPVYEIWLSEAVARGRISAPGFFADPAIRAAYLGAEWIGPSQGQLDPTKEITAEILAIGEGITTREQATIRLNGGQWDANVDQLTRENEKLRAAQGQVDQSTAASGTISAALREAIVAEAIKSIKEGDSMRTHNTPRLCAGPQTAGTPIKFWNVASIGDDEGEITLYGDVVSRQPVDWWTGEPEPGLYIAPESFMEDLAAVKGKSNITIKINSCGGDLYTGIAIHNAIKGLTGHKVVVVEGIAASAASVIAWDVGGSLNAFIQQMNARAAELGCTSATFTCAHGLYDYGNVASAEDMAKIAAACAANETFAQVAGSTTYTLGQTNFHSEQRTISSSNPLMDASGAYYKDSVKWVKGGFTTLAGRCAVALAQKDGHTYGLVILGSDSNEHLYSECDALFDWAFASFADRPLVDTQTVVTTVDLTKCRTHPEVELYAAAPVSGYGHADDKVSYSFDLPESVSATVKKRPEAGHRHGVSGTAAR